MRQARLALLIFFVFKPAFAAAKKKPKEPPKALFSVVYKNPLLEKNILFVHGTPGSNAAFADYMVDSDLRERANMIAVDRLGFGKSKSKTETHFKNHSEAILRTVQERFGPKKFLCVGHSYGSPLCADLMVRYPNVFEKAILIAGALNPHRPVLKWYNYFASLWLLQAVLPRSLIVSNKEMYGLKRELKRLESKLKKITKPVLILHGEKDKIVPFEDSVWLYEQLKGHNTDVKMKSYKEEGHFVLWKRTEDIKNEILNFL